MLGERGESSLPAEVRRRVHEMPRGARVAVVAAVGLVVVVGLMRPAASTGDDMSISDQVAVSSETSTPTPAAAGVVVHVVGAVRRPGVYNLPAGSRVGDAVAAAGGALGNAAPDAVNLARVLNDGEQVRIPSADEASAAVAASGAPSDAPRKVNINTATAAELDTLPGIGPATAQKIVDDRERNGPFASPEDLMRVPGIGPKKFDALKDLVTTG
ncbi:MAG: ComEA family DNA-binding protein [Anaerosomatales bacterium]|nr:ComEA family DNA-binding protein [Anaerosomatales bacterium]